MSEWIDVNKQLPSSGKNVLIFYEDEYGLKVITVAEHIGKKEILEMDCPLDNYSADFCEYDKESDCYWLPEGWFEITSNSESNVFLDKKVKYWMDLPKFPETK